MEALVYQTMTSDYTAKQTAEEFARVYFDKPRKVVEFTPLARQDGTAATFKLENGIAPYCIRYKPGVRLVSVALWQVYRLPPN